MKSSALIIFVVVLVVAFSHRLPAPVIEDNQSPAPEQLAKPKSKTALKPKPKPKTEANESSANSVRPQPSAKRSRFAGTWVGTMQTIPWGNLPSVVTIDSNETAMAMSWYEADEPGNAKIHQHFKAAPESARGHASANPAFAKALIEGDTIIASFPAPLMGKSRWSLTPQPDGVTAKVRMQAFMNDFTAVFQRVGSD